MARASLFAGFAYLLFALGAAELPVFRQFDPVVLTGSDLPELISKPIDRIAGFVDDINSEEVWTQIPIQIDERHYQYWDVIKDGDCRILGRNATDLVYADPNTLSGPDEDPLFDENDELVFMARYLGPQVPKSTKIFPPNTIQEEMYEVRIVDPENFDNTVGFVYFFILEEADVKTGMEEDLVSYNFQLSKKSNDTGSSEYKDVYKFTCDHFEDIHECYDDVMNPEDSWFRSAHYERHFSENWWSDQLHIITEGADGENFWGMEEFQFILSDCGRSTKSFIHGPTAFVANIDGPVRAIRSWVGANSGAITQRETKMYEQREDQTTIMRVHTIPGTFDYINFKAGVPLTYYSERNPDGFNVDGTMSPEEEDYSHGFSSWEMVTSSHGTFLRSIDVIHDLGDWFGQPDISPNDFMRSWYYDNAVPSGSGDNGAPEHPNGWSLCTSIQDGQKEAWGTMGFKLKDYIYIVPNTDPTRHAIYDNLPEEACAIETAEPWIFHVVVQTNQFYLPPDLSTQDAAELSRLSMQPLARG